MQIWVPGQSAWDSLAGRTRDASFEVLPTRPGFFLDWWQWCGLVYASFKPSRNQVISYSAWAPLCLPVWVSWEAACSPWALHVPPIQVLSADTALINLPLLLLRVVAHPEFSTPAPLITLLRFFTAVLYRLMQNSTDFCFVCNFFKVYTKLNYFWIDTTLFHLFYFESGSVPMLRITFPFREKIHLLMGRLSGLQNLSE